MRRCARLFASWEQTKRNVAYAGYRGAIAGLVERHDGRIVNTWGDAVIAEFASVVEAVQCAVGFSRKFQSGSDPPHAHQMRFRIGIKFR